MKKDAIALFSGGKDSMYAIMETLPRISLIVSIKNREGNVQFHAGPEADDVLRKAQLNLMGLPYKEIITSGKDSYMEEALSALKKIVDKKKIKYIITGDLWLPYTTKRGDKLARQLGVKVLRPCKPLCPSKCHSQKYMKKILDSKIKSIVCTVRKGVLPRKFIGQELDKKFLRELKRRKIDAAGERSEYQSLVVTSPLMKGEIVIDSFDTHLTEGRMKGDAFYRMHLKDYHIEG